jgi:hypothetical protein
MMKMMTILLCEYRWNEGILLVTVGTTVLAEGVQMRAATTTTTVETREAMRESHQC